MDKHDLGVHTEMFTNSMVDMVEAGVITGKKKTLHKGKMVGVFAYGEQRLYDMINDNPSIMLMRGSYVNHPAVVAQNDNMVSINTTLAVDLTGQWLLGIHRLPAVQRLRGRVGHLHRRHPLQGGTVHRGHPLHHQGRDPVLHQRPAGSWFRSDHQPKRCGLHRHGIWHRPHPGTFGAGPGQQSHRHRPSGLPGRAAPGRGKEYALVSRREKDTGGAKAPLFCFVRIDEMILAVKK